MLYKLEKNVRSRAATAENKEAKPGAGGMANHGHKGSPCITPFPKGETATLLDVEGPGIIRHLWFTLPPGNVEHLRNVIIRMYWDNQSHPSVEAPIGDFFGIAHGRQKDMNTEFVGMQVGRGLNCWIPMPFHKRAVITIENDSNEDVSLLFYQIDFTLGDDLDDDAGYFHAQFRRENPCPIHEDFTILDGIKGRGVYLGTVLGVRNLYQESWWGEGEVKFYIDDDEEYPTICGTGTEDYMGSAWELEEIVTPFQGAPLADKETGLYSIYRFHAKDPIYFQHKLKVTIQQMGIGSAAKAEQHFGEDFRRHPAAGLPPDGDDCYFDLRNDYSSVAYWYQTLPSKPFPKFPDRELRSEGLPPLK